MCCDGTQEPPDAQHAELAVYRKLLRLENGSWGEPGWLNELPRYSAYVDMPRSRGPDLRDPRRSATGDGCGGRPGCDDPGSSYVEGTPGSDRRR